MLLKSGNVAYLGLLLGINQVFIILSSVIETNTIIFFAAAALTVGIAVVEFGGKSGTIFYFASVMLGFVLSFNKIEMGTYALFFGIYALAKHYIEKKQMKPAIEIIIKFIFFNISLAIMYYVLGGFIAVKLYWWMVLGAEILFYIYDYAFTIFINHYIDKIKPKIKFRSKQG